MNRDIIEIIKKLLAVLTVIILIGAIGHYVSVVAFNSEEHKVEGADNSHKSYMEIAERGDSTSKWVKRDFDLNGQTVDLNAQTFDGTFYNNASHDISSWKMRININGDCFINNTWCGTVEIHQHNGKADEKVQTLDLRNYDLKEVKLDYLYDGDLLIPLEAGDYIDYKPSEKDDEVPVTAGTELTMGMIFYYIDDIDLSDYSVTFNYHKNFGEGRGFYAVLILALLWLMMLTGLITADFSSKRAWKNAELRRSGISYMAGIYDDIFIIDIDDDEITELKSEDTSSQKLTKLTRIDHANAQLEDMFLADADDSYIELMHEFLDLRTLGKRLDKDSIACEYLSKTHGWCEARFIAMERVEGEPLRKAIFTNKIINDEKIEMDRIEESLKKNTAVNVIVPEESPYDFAGMVNSIVSDAAGAASEAGVEVTTDLSPKIPAEVIGCSDIISRAVRYGLLKAIEYSHDGTVKLSVFCNPKGEKAHLLVSVKGSSGAGEDKAAEFDLVDGLLKLAGSGLDVIDEDGSREIYFELDQSIAEDGKAEV